MNTTLLKICAGGLAGLGLGLIIGKNKIEQLETELDTLELQNKCLTADRDLLQMSNDNLKETNKLFANLLLQENEIEES